MDGVRVWDGPVGCHYLAMKKSVLLRLYQKIPTVKSKPHLNDGYEIPYPHADTPLSLALSEQWIFAHQKGPNQRSDKM